MMRTVHLLATLTVLLSTLSIASVYAPGYQFGTPTLKTRGAPALAPSLGSGNYAGVITVSYSDGAPVVLSTDQVELNVCSPTNCVILSATLKQTAPGTYSYSFKPPSSLTGTITIYIRTGSLADENGRQFPSVTTQIGAYASPTSPQAPEPARQALPGLFAAQQWKGDGEMREAVVETQPKQESPIAEVLMTLTVLVLSAFGLLIFPSRRN